MLSPLLFNIFFAAATEVVLVRFSEDDTILKDLVYLEEEAGVGTETPLERARRAVWGTLYLSPLSDMSPATFDCLEPYFSEGFYFIFQLPRVC